MRHRWAWSWGQTVRLWAWAEKCSRCGVVRKRVQRHWVHAWPGSGWLACAPKCTGEKDDRQRELFTPTEGQVTT